MVRLPHRTIMENEKVKLLWDFSVQRDKFIVATRHSLVLDRAITGNTRVVKKEDERIDMYRELAFEIRRLWNAKTK